MLTALLDPTEAPERATAPVPQAQCLEWGLRSRSARRAESLLHRREPVVLLTPRWANSQGFLEDIALDLAVGEPPLGCRTLSLRSLQGKEAPASWQTLLKVIGELGQNRWYEGKAREVAERKGFRHALGEMLDLAQERIPYPVALLAWGAEVLPGGVVEDLYGAWADYNQQYGATCKCVLLVAGAVDGPALQHLAGQSMQLSDYSVEEAVTRLGDLAGRASYEEVQNAARVSGGVPSIVEAMGRRAETEGELPGDPWDLFAGLGPLADEIRSAVDIVMSDTVLGTRLESLQGGRPLLLDSLADHRLILSGLARQVRWGRQICIAMRAPLFDLLLE